MGTPQRLSILKLAVQTQSFVLHSFRKLCSLEEHGGRSAGSYLEKIEWRWIQTEWDEAGNSCKGTRYNFRGRADMGKTGLPSRECSVTLGQHSFIQGLTRTGHMLQCLLRPSGTRNTWSSEARASEDGSELGKQAVVTQPYWSLLHQRGVPKMCGLRGDREIFLCEISQFQCLKSLCGPNKNYLWTGYGLMIIVCYNGSGANPLILLFFFEIDLLEGVLPSVHGLQNWCLLILHIITF